jgi:aminoglycoside phosphotransferase (APT) family kinase protein
MNRTKYPPRVMLESLRLIGQGRAAEVFEMDDNRVIKVARVGGDAAIEREAAALRVAHNAGAPVPTIFEEGRFDDRAGIVMSRARGIDMLTELSRRPWMLFRTGAKLGRLHAQVHRVDAPSELPSVKQYVADRIAAAPIDEALRTRVLTILHELPDGDRLCHLDFHPGNVIRDAATMVVIDWSSAACGDPLADVAFTILGLEGGEPPPGTPLLTRLFAPVGRRMILRGYRRAYIDHAELDEARLARWRVVAAGARLSYQIPGETDRLVGIIRSA